MVKFIVSMTHSTAHGTTDKKGVNTMAWFKITYEYNNNGHRSENTKATNASDRTTAEKRFMNQHSHLPELKIKSIKTTDISASEFTKIDVF